MRPAQVHAALKRESDRRGRAFTELLTLYALERFLARLTLTPYSRDLVLKGGVLLAAYQLRRPTRDIDMQLVGVILDEQHLRDVVDAVATVGVQDGLVLDPTEPGLKRSATTTSTPPCAYTCRRRCTRSPWT